MVTEETLEGIGTTGSLLHTLFGSILRLAQPTPPEQSPYLNPPGSPTTPSTCPPAAQASDPSTRQQPPSKPLSSPQSPARESAPATTNAEDLTTVGPSNTTTGSPSTVKGVLLPKSSLGQASKAIGAVVASGHPAPNQQEDGEGEFLDIHDHPTQLETHQIQVEDCDDELSETRLTRYLPEPGYFVAGALAGGISRTATAPFDRLKVFLLVKTDTEAGLKLNAAKKGHLTGALSGVGKPIGDAMRTLWKAGGFRTFFAGMQLLPKILS